MLEALLFETTPITGAPGMAPCWLCDEVPPVCPMVAVPPPNAPPAPVPLVLVPLPNPPVAPAELPKPPTDCVCPCGICPGVADPPADPTPG